MKILTSDESEELTEHFSSRRDIWVIHNGVWLRQLQVDEYGLGLHIRNGLPDGLYALTHKPLSWTEPVAQEYVEWLLEKYTAYPMRMEVVKLLHKYNLHPVHTDALSRDLCNLHGGPFVRKHPR